MGSKDRAKKREERLRQQKHKQHFTRKPEPPPPRDEISLQIAPDDLKRYGAHIEATCTVPRVRAALLLKAGRPVPVVSGYLLLDTGAAATCIAEDAAIELGLKPTGIRETYGVGGLHKNPEYFVRLELKDLGIATERPLIGVKDMNAQKTAGSKRLLGLLGREFLRFATLSYDGVRGQVKVRIERQQLKPV